MNFNFTHNYLLEDDRVVLRPIIAADLQHLAHFVINEPEIWKYSLISVGSVTELETYINTTLTAREQGKEYAFIVYDKKLKQYAGSTRFYDIQPQYNTLQLGYTWYGKDFQGTGLNKHCKYLLLQFAFEQLGAARVEFRADAANEKSIAAMKSIGCTPEGILRSHLPKLDGTRRDSIILSILEAEWFDSVKSKLKNNLTANTDK